MYCTPQEMRFFIVEPYCMCDGVSCVRRGFAWVCVRGGGCRVCGVCVCVCVDGVMWSTHV